jgi:uncharacterized damage-inducible protein DinB
MPSAVDLLLSQLDQAFDRKSWHGTNLRGSIRGLDVDVALHRPAPKRRCIWEIVVHAAYWKYTVRRRLLQEKRGSFPLKGSDWFPLPEDPSDEAWRAEIALLEEMHRTLRAAVAELRPANLEFTPPGSEVSNLHLVSGIIAHDVYHAGQIQLLKRLAQGPIQ